MGTVRYWGIEDFDILADDLDSSLTGLGATSTAFDMSEALSALQVLKSDEENHKIVSKNSSTAGSPHKLDSFSEREKSPWTLIHAEKSSKLAKKPCRKSIVSTKNDNSDASDLNSPEHPPIPEENTLTRVASAPLLSQSLYKSAFQPGSVAKVDNVIEAEFQYILAAPTTLGSKIGEETLTYLNQGQSYEIRLKKLKDLTEMRGKLLKSMMRVGFQERRLQFREKAELIAWQNQRPYDRILDIDHALSYGIFDVHSDPRDINCCEFMWDPTRESSVFVRINCISTEFTCKRKGGEKGVAFRILITTYSHWEDPPRKLHATSCLVKIFKAKGADRKRKTDREKIEKLPQSEQRDLQPSYPCTIFTECSTEANDILSRDNSTESLSYTQNLIKNELIKTEVVPLALTSEKSGSSQSQSPLGENTQEHRIPVIQRKQVVEEDNNLDTINSHLTSSDVCNWLVKHRFSKFLSHFSAFSGKDVLFLGRDDLIEICGIADGIRLYNALHKKYLCPSLTIYISSGGQSKCKRMKKLHALAFHALFFETLTAQEMKEQLCKFCQLHEQNMRNMYIIGPASIMIYICNKVVQHMKNESVFIVQVLSETDSDKFCIVLQHYPTDHNSAILVSDSFCVSPADSNL